MASQDKDAAHSSPARKDDGGNSSLASLLDAPAPSNPIMRRRPSLFDQLDKPLSQRNNNDEVSSFSLASLTQESSQRRVMDRENKKRSRSSFSCSSSANDDSSATTSTLSASTLTSRSLFGSLTATTVCNSQATNTKNNIAKKTKSNTSQAGNVAAASTRTSLFGSVMQNVGLGSSPSEFHKSLNKTNSTTPKAARHRTKCSAFTPEQSRATPFGSPGGHQMLDFVNTFASPFHKSNSNHSHSNLSTKSHVESKEWQNTSIEQGVTDWSLPESLAFECHPAHIVNSVLIQSPEKSGQGMVKFLQSNLASSRTTNTDEANKGTTEWDAGLLYWQHPAVHPSPFVAQPSKKEAPKANNPEAFKRKDEDPFRKPITNKKRRVSLNLAEAKRLENMADVGPTNQHASSLQQQKNFTRQRRLEWKQSFVSLYWKWISFLQKLQKGDHDAQALDKAYFYARGEDHVVLLRGVEEDGSIVPMILISSSSAVFRDKLRQLGVERLCLSESWNGHAKGTVFAEKMIQPNSGKAHGKGKTATDETERKESNSSEAGTLQSPTKENQKGSSSFKQAPPSLDSNSPFVKAELAALRRAQVFGETVGADVTISMEKKPAAGPKLSLASVPPLTVKGFDDCTAFHEAYLNMVSSCCAARNPEATKHKGDGSTNDQNGLRLKAEWQAPQDVPLLICRSVGPFCNATMKSLTVRGNAQHLQKEPGSPESNNSYDYDSVEVQGGPILPCASKQLFCGLAQIMTEDKRRNALAFPKTDNYEEAMVGSHNLILRPAQGAAKADSVEQQSSKHRNIGSWQAHPFNQSHPGGGRGKNAQGHVLRMAVWDILHPNEIAYKVEPAAPTVSLFP